MKFKLNPLTGEFDYTSESANKQKLNPLTGEFNLVEGDGPFSQIFNPLNGTFNLGTRGGGGIIAEVTGNGYINLTNAVAHHLMELKAYGGTEQSNLPKGYTQLEYTIIPSGGYLKTDFIPTYDCKVELEFTTTTLGASGATTYLGVRPSTTGNGGLRCARISTKVFRIYGFGSYQDSTNTAAANTRYKFTWDNQRGIVTTGSTTVFDKTYSDIGSNTYPLTINGWNSAGTVTPGAEDVYVHSFKAWDNQGVLAANYIPCVYNNEVGFYDTVSESFKGATAGTFTAGPTATPTPEQPMNIISNNGAIKFSKNLANMVLPNVVEQYYIDNSGNILSSPVNFYYDTFIPVSPNTAYTLSGSKNFRYASLMEYDINQVFLKRTLIDNASTNAKTWTTRNDTAYIRFGSNPGSNETMTIDVVQSYNFQFERGSVPTPYHEYVEGGIYTEGVVETIQDELSNTAIAEMLLKVGDYVDEQEILSGNIIRKVGVQVFDGTENWKSAVTGKFYIDNYYMRNYNSMPTLCTHYEAVSASSTSQVGFGKIGLFATATQGQSSARLVIGDDNYTSVDDFKAYLSQQYQAGTPIIVLYPLIEQTTETVSGQSLDIPAGNSTIEITQASIDNLPLYAKYLQSN